MDSITASMNQNGQTDEDRAAYEAKMAAVADDGLTKGTIKDSRTGESAEVNAATPTDGSTVAERPADIPEKFWDAENGKVNVAALLKSQQDAEAALRKQTTPEATPEETPEATPEAAAEATQENVVAKASAEFAEAGALSDETFGALEGVGLSREMVNEYIEGQQAIISSLQDAAFGEFEGGKETYETAAEWAVNNLSEDELQALDVQITSRNPGIVKQGAAALAAKYSANADVSPTTTVTGQGNQSVSGSAFRSGAEMQAAMRDARYKTDPAFRAEVSAKVAAASRAGIDLFA